ncbi:MAG: hypothetical protein R6X25_01965 [Candidatus Krumholzibacteriia bacterium]
MLRFLIRAGVLAMLTLVVLESFFTWVLPASCQPRNRQDASTGLVSFDRSWRKSGVISHGPLCKQPSRWQINKAGYNSIYDYVDAGARARPLVALLGDSFVQGFYSDVQEHMEVHLNELFQGDVDVYAFGHAGAHLAQYMAMTEHFERVYDPDVYVYVVHGAVERAVDTPVRTYFSIAATDSGFELIPPRVTYQQRGIGRTIFRSSLLRYLYLNNRLIPAQNAIAVPDMGWLDTWTEADVARYRRAGRFALAWLDSVAPGKPKVFVVDAPRDQIYESTEDLVRDMDYQVLSVVCDEFPDSYCLDLAPVFRENWQREQRAFNPDFDPHWNAHGDRVVAAAIWSFLRANDLVRTTGSVVPVRAVETASSAAGTAP